MRPRAEPGHSRSPMWSTSAPGRPAHEHRAGGCERAGCTFDECEAARQAARCISLGGLLLLPQLHQLRLLLRRQRILEADEESNLGTLELPLRGQNTIHLFQGLRLVDARRLKEPRQLLPFPGQLELRLDKLSLRLLHGRHERRALRIGQSELALMLHDQLGRKQQAGKRVLWRLLGAAPLLSRSGRLLRRGSWGGARNRGHDNQRRDEQGGASHGSAPVVSESSIEAPSPGVALMRVVCGSSPSVTGRHAPSETTSLGTSSLPSRATTARYVATDAASTTPAAAMRSNGDPNVSLAGGARRSSTSENGGSSRASSDFSCSKAARMSRCSRSGSVMGGPPKAASPFGPWPDGSAPARSRPRRS